MLVSAMPPPRAWPSPVDQSLSRCHRRRGCRLDDRGARSTVNRPAARASHSRHLDSGSELRARVVNANGTREPYVTIAATTADRTSGYARMVRTGTELVFAWVSTKPKSQIRTAVATVR
jgi:hypothetical protein